MPKLDFLDKNNLEYLKFDPFPCNTTNIFHSWNYIVRECCRGGGGESLYVLTLTSVLSATQRASCSAAKPRTWSSYVSPRLGFPLAGKLMKVGAEFMFSCVWKIHRRYSTTKSLFSNTNIFISCNIITKSIRKSNYSINTFFKSLSMKCKEYTVACFLYFIKVINILLQFSFCVPWCFCLLVLMNKIFLALSPAVLDVLEKNCYFYNCYKK